VYLTAAKTIFIEALEKTFDEEYPDPRFRGLWVSQEYPLEESNYPGIWVDFRPTGDTVAAGIGHTEWSAPGADGSRRRCTRWRFAGTLSMTVVAMTSLERSLLVDSLASLIAFGHENPATSEYRVFVESNDLCALQGQWSTFAIGGTDETQGTPWGTDDVMYETTITQDFIGEVVSDGTLETLIPLSAVIVTEPVAENEGSPTPPPGSDGWV
jgi:hypothetical protein